MKKVLVTGSEGYIGKHLVKMLENNYDVYKLDLVDPTNSIDIRKSININIEFDTVIHLAALVNVSKSTKFPLEYHDTNVNGTVNCLRDLQYKNFVFASTGSAAGLASPYAISKKMAELIVEDYCRKNNKNYTMFRFYNVTGVDGFPPTNPDGLMASLIRAQTEGIFYVYGGDEFLPDFFENNFCSVTNICNINEISRDRFCVIHFNLDFNYYFVEFCGVFVKNSCCHRN